MFNNLARCSDHLAGAGNMMALDSKVQLNNLARPRCQPMTLESYATGQAGQD